MLHGFTGNPQSMRPQAEALAAEGYTVELPLLPGHGTAVEDMIPTRWSDYAARPRPPTSAWPRAATPWRWWRCRWAGPWPVGWPSSHAEIAGMVLVNPFVDPPAESFRDVLRGILDSGHRGRPRGRIRHRQGGFGRARLSRVADRGRPEPVRGDRRGGRGLAEITCPVLLLSSRQDHVVPSSSGDVLVDRVSGPIERVWLERSYHVATLDYDAELVVARTVAFVRDLVWAQRSRASKPARGGGGGYGGTGGRRTTRGAVAAIAAPHP